MRQIIIKRVILLLGLCLLPGCATMFQGSTQDITVTTTNDKTPDKTRCKITNEEGAWSCAPKVSVNIHRDGNRMSIQCENDTQTGVIQLEPEFKGGYLALDLLLDLCIISCTVDGVNNSFYQYPSFATVQMMDK